MTRLCVCVPARNEAGRLAVLLDALAQQDWPQPIAVALCINNTSDDSLARLAAARETHGERLALTIDDHVFPVHLAHAGSARRRAMDIGMALVDPVDGILLSTDADCRPPADWIAGTVAAIDGGADIVGGRIVVDEAEPVAADMLAMLDRIDAYWDAVRAIEDAIDPRDWDRPPRHGDHTGASLAITARLYRRAGGVPTIPTGEDRALVDAGIAAGGRLAHPAAVWTRVSPRRSGRAAGGMAQDMARLEALAAAGVPPLLPALAAWRERAIWRRTLRQDADGDARIAREEPLLPPMPCDTPVVAVA